MDWACAERAVRAYKDGTDRYTDVAVAFGISLATLVRWVQRARDTGSLAPWTKRAGGSRPSICRCSTVWSTKSPTGRRTS